MAPPLSHDVYSRPLDAVFLEHDRQLKVSAWLLRHVKAQRIGPLQEMADGLLGFLTEDFLWHHRDEDEDLLPILRSRCEPEDKIGGILAELNQDHATESFLMRDIVVDLRRVVEGRGVERPSRFFSNLRIFADGQERHISWENKVVLPLAQVRLTTPDLQALGEAIAARWSSHSS